MALSNRALEFASLAAYCGPLEGAERTGRSGSPGEGPYMLIEICMGGGRISKARFQTYGCPTARACGSLACQLLEGRSLEQAAQLTGEDLVLLLGGIPEGKEYCPRMTYEAVQAAIRETDKEEVH